MYPCVSLIGYKISGTSAVSVTDSGRHTAPVINMLSWAVFPNVGEYVPGGLGAKLRGWGKSPIPSNLVYDQSVTNSRLGFQMLGLMRFRLKLLSQMRHVHTQVIHILLS